MKKIILLLSICFLFIFGCKLTSPSENDVTTFRIINRTDVTFNRLNIRISGENRWDQTLWGDYTNGTHEIYLTRYLDNQKRYDIQLQTSDNRTATYYNTDVFENAIFEYDYENFDDASSMEVKTIFINNLAGIDFTEIMIGEVGKTGWVFSKTTYIPNDEIYALSNISPALDRTTQYRIRLRAGNQTVTKNSEAVWQYRTIVFTENDF